ncbi:MAG: AAA family ATPase, partial [Calditrichota bacterium]
MYFEQLHLLGFGCLRTRVNFVPDRVNLAVADNEAGKSTLISALLAAFYGIVEDERVTRDKRPHRKMVLPWSNPEEFGLALDFNMNGACWRIERDFNSGHVSLINRSSGRDYAEDYHRGRNVYNIGEELIGLSCGDFLKSFYLKQDEILEIKEAGGLTPHVQRVATAREGGATSEQAIQRLEAALKEYPYQNTKGLRIENALKRMHGDRDTLSEELERLHQSRAEIEPQCRRLTEIETQLEEIKRQREECERLGNLAKIHDLTQLIEQQRQLQSERSRIEVQLTELKTYEQFPAGKEDQLNHLSGRVEQLQSALDKQREKLKNEVEARLQELEKNLQTNNDLAGITETELREFEVMTPRFTDRHERAEEARRECERGERKLASEGVERSRFNRLQSAFSSLRPEERKFLEEFRGAYAEEESLYCETRTRREWLEKERGSLVSRRQRVVGTSRMFALLAAVMAVSGGIMFMLTLGEWMSWVLAGLGLVFGGVAAMVRFSGGIGDKSTLRKLDE